MALAILSGMDAHRFAQCVEQEDQAALMRLPGIGNKTAERLIIEMRDRVGALAAGLARRPPRSRPRRAPAEAGPLSDAIAALIALGYRPLDANRMARAADDGAKTSEEIIRAALRGVA